MYLLTTTKHYFRVILKAVTVTRRRTPLLGPLDKTNRSHLAPNLHKLMCIDIKWKSSLSQIIFIFQQKFVMKLLVLLICRYTRGTGIECRSKNGIQ